MTGWLGIVLGLLVVVAPLLLAWLFMSYQKLGKEAACQRDENQPPNGGQP